MKLPRLALLTLVALMLTALSARAAAVPENIEILAKGGKGGWLNVTRPLTAADIQSHPVILLDFWTYGCINCQQVVPGHLLGRVNSVYRMLGWGLMPLGALAGGFLAHAAGLRAPYIAAGLLCGLSVLVAFPLLLAATRHR